LQRIEQIIARMYFILNLADFMENEKNNLGEIEQKKLSSQMNKQLSPRRAVLKIILAIVAFIWFLAGGSAQTVLSLSGGALGLNGMVSFFLRNPVTFLIIGIIQIVLGLIFLIFTISGFIPPIFHFLWSIRWFYGFFKYRHVKTEVSD